MNEYTPTTEEVRGAYHAWSDGQGDNFDEKPTWSFQEFDRWLAHIKDAAYWEGYGDGQDSERGFG